MYTESDPHFMQQALQLGARALLHAAPNPRVGCVIVRDGVVLGEGFTQRPGGNHAEIEALQDARRRGNDVHGATVYVTLEPCSHFGRTPPCATALIEARVGQVVAACEDPNPLVAGRGMDMLRNAGIDVRCGLLRQEAVEANIGFFSRMNRGRPWVRIKIAASLDGRTALPNGTSQWITGEAARADGHAWRARSCAILTGSGTVRADNPLLTVRGIDTPRQPLKVVVDSTLQLSEDARLFDGNAVLLATAQRDEAAAARFAHCNADVFCCPTQDRPALSAMCSVDAPDAGTARGHVDLAALLKELARRGINEVQVEAGATLSGALVRAALADELLLYLAPTLLGPGRPMLDLPLLENLDAARHLVVRECVAIGPDLRILARFS